MGILDDFMNELMAREDARLRAAGWERLANCSRELWQKGELVMVRAEAIAEVDRKSATNKENPR